MQFNAGDDSPVRDRSEHSAHVSPDLPTRGASLLPEAVPLRPQSEAERSAYRPAKKSAMAFMAKQGTPCSVPL
jgi:hypothetical protein